MNTHLYNSSYNTETVANLCVISHTTKILSFFFKQTRRYKCVISSTFTIRERMCLVKTKMLSDNGNRRSLIKIWFGKILHAKRIHLPETYLASRQDGTVVFKYYPVCVIAFSIPQKRGNKSKFRTVSQKPQAIPNVKHAVNAAQCWGLGGAA